VAPSTSLRTGKKTSFIVTGNDVRTEVLGTHFNINTYQDEEDSKVTLLEGAVSVRSEVGSQKSDVSAQPSDLRPQTSVVLKPGQQAAIHHSQLTIHDHIDLDKVMSWKTGMFSFDDDDLPTVLRQLARWYDVEVSYNGAMSQERYSGIISRQLTLSKVLAVLKLAGVKYTIEGKKLTLFTP
jgi:transmembrane sensor